MTDTFLETDVEDVISATGNSANTEALIVDLIPGALSTNSFYGVVANFAAALTILENLVDSTTSNTVSSTVEPEASRAFASL